MTDARRKTVALDGHVIGVDTILENRVVFGSVNANRIDWLAAVESLDRARERWPELLPQFVGLRVPLDRFAEAFAHTGVKAARARRLSHDGPGRARAERVREIMAWMPRPPCGSPSAVWRPVWAASASMCSAIRATGCSTSSSASRAVSCSPRRRSACSFRRSTSAHWPRSSRASWRGRRCWPCSTSSSRTCISASPSWATWRDLRAKAPPGRCCSSRR